MKSGVVIINKSEGLSSFAAVSRVKRLFSADKAGHTGTLDPLATGVLPVLIGRAVKASEYMLTSDKHYSATLLLGITTDTEDITGNVITKCDTLPTEAEVLKAIADMRGNSMQIPPMYSAIKVGGKKLYDIARAGGEIERTPREITVYEIKAKRLSDAEYKIDVHCSKGTYIRTLCADIGKSLGVGGVMKTLTRTEASGFSLEEAHTVEELEMMSAEERDAIIYPTEYIFKDVRKITLDPFFARLARCGVEIYLKKANISAELGERVTLYDDGGFFALGEVREFESGLAVKPIKQLSD